LARNSSKDGICRFLLPCELALAVLPAESVLDLERIFLE